VTLAWIVTSVRARSPSEPNNSRIVPSAAKTKAKADLEQEVSSAGQEMARRVADHDECSASSTPEGPSTA
jgi:hypothetical protein